MTVTPGQITPPGQTAPPPPPDQGNAIASNPLPWHTWLVGTFIVGIGIWLVEKYAGDRAGIILVALLLLGVMYKQRGFTSELANMLWPGGGG
jgi:hypothetical protein